MSDNKKNKKVQIKDLTQSMNGELPLLDATDNEILMHRDAHFGGQFELMLDYYSKGGKGVREEFTPKRIEYLAQLEKQLGENLAGLLLSGPEAEKVARSKETYKKLRDLYDQEGSQSKFSTLIADLILSEEEEVEQAMAAIVKEKGAVVPALIELLKTEDLHDPLFPGYGQAPSLAIQCLGKIGDKRSMVCLFETLGNVDFFEENQVLEAIKAIGEPVIDFLLHVLKGRPLNEDNERAAIALIHFKEDPQVAGACLELLKDPEVRKHIPLATYLILVCEGLKDEVQRKEFLELIKDRATPSILHMDMKVVSKEWEMKNT